MPDPSAAFDQFIAANPTVVRWVWGGLASFIVSLGAIIWYFARTTWTSQLATTKMLADQISGLSKLHHADVVVLKDYIRESVDRMGSEVRAQLGEVVRVFALQQSQHEQRLSRLEGEHAVYHLRRAGDAPKVRGENGGGD